MLIQTDSTLELTNLKELNVETTIWQTFPGVSQSFRHVFRLRLKLIFENGNINFKNYQIRFKISHNNHCFFFLQEMKYISRYFNFCSKKQDFGMGCILIEEG